jgi:twitching motility protein PilT
MSTQLQQLLSLMTERNASDLHLKPLRPPLIRIDGRLMPMEAEPLEPEEVEKMVMAILTPQQKEHLDKRMAVDIGYGVTGMARFRGNIYRQRGTLAASFRRVPFEIPTVDDLELPTTLLDFCDLPMGLVLVTGPTGSGKSTTLAAMIRHISERRPVHVITIEDPMEFLFSDDVASISQREVRTDTVSFAEAMRNVMRQDPDVLMVGEMRDPETIATVITAAETGHLVFSTLHTNSAAQSIDRVLDSFPSDQQAQVRAQLAQVLKGVVSMQLVERRDGGRVAALEIMKTTPKIAQFIEQGETGKLLDQIEGSVAYYRMQSMNQSLLSLMVHGTITYGEAMRFSTDPDDLSLKLRRMFPKIEEQGDDMSSTADFSEILELQQYRKLYDEQEERVKIRLAEKDDMIRELREALAERDRRNEELNARLQDLVQELGKLRTDNERLQRESKEKVERLNDRIRELNQQILQAS